MRKLLFWELFDSLNNVPSKVFVLEILSLDFIETSFFWFITVLLKCKRDSHRCKLVIILFWVLIPS